MTNRSTTTHCWIYRCSRRDEMYLYLAKEDDFDCLPANVLRMLGQLEAIMELDLQPGGKLARVDIHTVSRDLQERGFYIQLPPGRPEILDS